MLIKNYTRILASSLVLAVGLPLGTAHAHNLSGKIASRATSVVKYQITCSPNEEGKSAWLSYSTQNLTRGATFLLQATASKDGVAPQTVVDPNNKDRSPSSTGIEAGGDGVYLMTIRKQAILPKRPRLTGVAAFTLVFHCQSSSGGHTETSIVSVK